MPSRTLRSANGATGCTSLCKGSSDNGNNWTGWRNPAYDKLLDEANATANREQRFALLQRAESLLLEEAPIAPLTYRSRAYLIHPAVKNWQPSPLGLNRYQEVKLQN